MDKPGLIGIISDTHDNLPLITRAVRKFNRYQVDLVLHAGDYVSPFTIPYFKTLAARFIGVYGNNCAERELLKYKFTELDAELRGFFAEVNVEKIKIALLHGHDVELLTSLIHSGAYNIVIHGHTHNSQIKKVRKTMVINPGEACGYLTNRATIALLDTVTLEAKIVDLNKD